MAQYPCDCGGTVEVSTEHLGPIAARGLLRPVRALCADCIAARHLVVEQDGGLPFVRLDGREYRLIGGGFVRSENPQATGMYRDQQ